ncbi:FAD-dependent oxidoreductase [Longispora sp. K20-0274]|uniref:FAD-dependent oxidoreductase n=1 Tax=Longispora sp. K20-0274 TaxID=3088255 RepID=UPI00399B6A67
MGTVDVLIVGAGPYGLASAAHLRRAGVDLRILGDPMAFWRTMPKGMLLRSDWTATSIGEHRGPLSLDSYARASGHFGDPDGPDRPRGGGQVPVERFVEYGEWVQARVAPDVDRRHVARLDRDGDAFLARTADGATVRARRVVVAAGIEPFPRRPTQLADLPAALASHTSEHSDLSRFAGRRVLIVGGGQSALETAALLREGGADAEVVSRRDHVTWLHGGKYHRMLGRFAPLLYAPTDVGPMGLSRLVAVPDLFRRLPRAVQRPLAYRAVRPAGAAWLADRLRDVPVTLGRFVWSAEPMGERLRVDLDDGSTRLVDHLLFGTGYQVDIARYPFLPPELLRDVRTADGYPVLGRGLESSVPGLHFVGAPAAYSFGPIMRFVSGSWYASRALTRVVAR